ncbi:cobalamin synthase [Bacteroides sp. CAG:598]|jgi:adenosylcobinamide-GDP ribazoletransferase|nr:cobalamin synthase [Bacteroides sp. CAG:598]
MNFLAALIFFTRLPFWKIREVPAECFKHVVPYWPLVGWLTGSIMAGVLWLAAQVLPLPVAWLLAILSRLLVTGCLHEDGLADFFDGFGGGTTRERILAIMKDSHIGTYGVVGLIFYFLLFWQLPSRLPLSVLCALALCCDCWSKFCASQIINYLPYARPEAESKAKVVYSGMNRGELITAFVSGILPLLFLLPLRLWPATVVPMFVCLLLCRFLKKKLQGYTGDCCGAMFLLCEISFYLCAVILWKLL